MVIEKNKNKNKIPRNSLFVALNGKDPRHSLINGSVIYVSVFIYETPAQHFSSCEISGQSAEIWKLHTFEARVQLSICC